ncbi:Formyltetrahydrofolate deformylase [Halioglobus japonicus]|nr:Formyltetrahydrofolate deformylase [Halioglobus japonicus]
MQTSFIVTFIGDDRPGLVEQLSVVIEKNQGNWQESKLSQLGGKFAGLILVSLPQDGGPALEADLGALAASGISVRVTPTDATSALESAPPVAGRDITLTVIGPDRRGIVREISAALAQRKINVLEMDTNVQSAPMSAEPIFEARIAAWIPEATNMDDLQASLDEIADNMTLEIDLA